MDNVKTIAYYDGFALATRALIDALKEGGVGAVYTDEELKKICGKDTAPGGEGYGNLQSAINYVMQNYDLVWERERGQKRIRMISSREKINTMTRGLCGIRRRTRKNIRVASTIDRGALTPEESRKAEATAAALGVINMFTKPKTVKKIEETGNSHLLPTQSQIVALFRKDKNKNIQAQQSGAKHSEAEFS
ncbi:MAG TPA: hypothetical protein PLK80_03280 [bacterium]|nr:MAG: hypothetical protein BWY28_02150 [bacterium ADurb.Bin236]HOY61643.1 hypothetical protein [bacterium]HPI75729.1 hypothetical protein [bacterium]HPN95046.1 hypothetical protein [bacterium]